MSARMLGFLLAALAGLLAMAPLADAASISGKVFREGSSPLAGIQGVCVQADGPGDAYLGTYTAADGSYAFTGLAAGTWYVDAKPCGKPFDVVYASSEQSRTVTADEPVTGLTLYLAAATRSIAGRVTGQGNAPLQRATVRLYNGPSGGSQVDTAETAFDGTYTVVPNAYDTDYRLEIGKSQYATEWHLDKPSRAAGNDIAVSAGAPHATGIDAALTFNQGTISGTVTNAGGDPLADVQVVATAISGGGGETKYTYTSATGAYALAVQAGTYTVRFQPKHGGTERPITSGDYLEERWNDAPPPGTTVTVAGGATFTASAQLARGARVAGKVVDEKGLPLVDYEVKAYVRDNDPAPGSPLQTAVTYTNAAGEYAVRGIPLSGPTDRFYVSATPHCCDVPRTNQYNPGAASSEFTLAPGQQIVDKTIVAPTLGRLAARITRPGGVALGEQYEVLFLTADGRVVLRNTAFGAPLEYKSPLLVPGQYRVRVQPDTRNAFGVEYWQNATRLADTTPVTIVAAQETRTDMELAPLAAPRPANDDVVGATNLGAAAPVTAASTNLAATRETGEPNVLSATSSVWWRWTAPADGVYVAEGCGDEAFSDLVVFIGAAANGLTAVPGQATDNGTCAGRNRRFTATAGTSYLVGTFAARFGDVEIAIAPYDATVPESFAQLTTASTLSDAYRRPGYEAGTLTFRLRALSRSSAGVIEGGTQSFTCSMDGAPFAACPSTHPVSGLAAGSHVLRYRATVDGKTDPTPGRLAFFVGTPDPDCASPQDEDGDGAAGWPTDVGCTSDLDDDERDVGSPVPPPADGDGDGVPDASDACPAAVGTVANLGCPVVVPPVDPPVDPPADGGGGGGAVDGGGGSPGGGGGAGASGGGGGGGAAPLTPIPPVLPPAGTAQSRDRTVDGATLEASTSQRQKRGLAISLTVGAREPVTLTTTGAVKVGRKSYALRSVKRSLAAGRTATLKLALGKSSNVRKVRAALRRKPKATVTVTFTDAAGNTLAKKLTVTLRA